MTHKCTVIPVGNSEGIILSKDIKAKLGIKKGDDLYLYESSNGYTLTAYDPEFEKQLEEGQKIFQEYRNTFSQLAK